jgi:dTDP-4-amino-4,6-dideoxygalactose transaminase
MSATTEPPLIPLFDLRLEDEDIAAVTDVLRSGWLTMGPRTAEFERTFGDHLGVRHAIAVSSCTAALHLAYLAAGVGPGDEVIVPSITFVATAAAVRQCGGVPIPVDVCGPHDLGIDPEDVARNVTPRTKAVCVVHYAGYPVAVEEVRAVCAEHGLALIEDAAHAPSARPRNGGGMLGTLGLAGAFSFFSNKVLSCGEGGLLATDDDHVADVARSLRSHSMTSGTWDRHRGHATSYDVTGVGFNYRLDEPRAALLLARLPRLEADIERRRALVRRYRELLADVDGVTVPFSDGDVGLSSCYVMPVVVDPGVRDELRGLLLERHRVQTTVIYPAIHELSAYRHSARHPLPQSELVARGQVTLPLYPHLTEEQLEYVVDAVRAGLAELRG